MENISAIVIIVLTLLISYRGFKNPSFFKHYLFEVDAILVEKQYIRLISSGFLHSGWVHFIFNMLTLYFFCDVLILKIGYLYFLLIYFTSLLGGNLFALYLHRNDSHYSAIGASGAVCGVIFACIALFPDIKLGFFGLQPFMPSWLYAIFFVLYSLYGIKSKDDNIGHEAHLGGALVGMTFTLALYPNIILVNYLPIMLVYIPTTYFLYLLITSPEYMMADNAHWRQSQYHNVEDNYNHVKFAKQSEIDRILDKISSKGINSLTKEEKKTIDNFSN